jgi:hypothetical protein
VADGFLGRWSRRKQDVREGKPVEEPPAPSVPVPTPARIEPATTGNGPIAPQSEASAPDPMAEAPPPPTLSDAEALTPASDFKPFVDRAVSPEVRNLAMKKLFSDPHFNVMDGLDIYIDDYTQPDPLPAGMLRKMASAHAMGFFDEEKKQEAQEAAVRQRGVSASAQEVTPTGGSAIAPEGAQPRDDAEAHATPDVAQSGVCNAVPSVLPSEPGVAPRSVQDVAAMPASHIENDHDAPLRLQPDDAAQPQSVGRGTE